MERRREQTNEDRIRTMTVEELADMMERLGTNSCEYCVYEDVDCGEKDCRDGFVGWLRLESDSQV